MTPNRHGNIWRAWGGAVLFLAAALLLYRSVGEPEYQGQLLRTWLPLFENPSSGARIKATEAVTQNGTNALPLLESMLRAHDSELKLRLMAAVQKQSIWQFRFWPASQRRLQAIKACRVLGRAAAPLVPALVDCLADREAGQDAAYTLAVIDPELFPLTRALTNSAYSPALRASVARRLASGPYSIADATRMLEIAAQDSDRRVRRAAVASVASLRAAPARSAAEQARVADADDSPKPPALVKDAGK